MELVQRAMTSYGGYPSAVGNMKGVSVGVGRVHFEVPISDVSRVYILVDFMKEEDKRALVDVMMPRYIAENRQVPFDEEDEVLILLGVSRYQKVVSNITNKGFDVIIFELFAGENGRPDQKTCDRDILTMLMQYPEKDK